MHRQFLHPLTVIKRIEHNLSIHITSNERILKKVQMLYNWEQFGVIIKEEKGNKKGVER
jgi:hypothetical protein